MANLVRQVVVDIVRGFEQKDTRWAQWASIYAGSQDPFAFWEVTTTEQASREDIRALAKERTQGSRTGGGYRPGQAVNEDFAPFTTFSDENPDNLNPYEDRTAVLKIVKRSSVSVKRSIAGQRVVGERVDKYNQTVQVAKPIIQVEGFETILETNSFLLQSSAESFQEKYQISETFGEPVFFAFGERQKIFQYSGILFDTANWQWKEEFIDNYNRHLRGSKAIESDAVAILITNTAIIRGHLLNCSIGQATETQNFVSFSFSMFVQDRIPLEPIALSPQDQKAAQEKDSQLVFFRVNDKTGKPGEVIKELKLTNGSIELPTGFQLGAFGQTDPPASKPTSWKPNTSTGADAAIGGVTKVMTISNPPQVTYDPPDLDFTEALPSSYLNEMIAAVLGRIDIAERQDLEAPPGDGSAVVISLATDPPAVGSWISAQVFRDIGDEVPPPPGKVNYTTDQVDKLEAIAKAGNLIVDIAIGSNPTYVRRKVASFTRLNGLGFRHSVFEFTTDSAISPSVWGLPVYSNNPLEHVFRCRWYEDKTFVITIPIRRAIFHAIGPNKVRRVGGLQPTSSPDGINLPKNSTEKHVLTDPLGNFNAELSTFFANKDKIYVRLPYQVIDEDAGTLTPTAEVEVRGIISDTQLQLGLLRKDVANQSGLERQRIGMMNLPTYSVVVKRATSISLVELAIRDSVKNPPTGAFSEQDLSKAEVTAPLGSFKLEKGKHYNA